MTEPATVAVRSGPSRAFAALTGLTSLAIFAQAITAGAFINQPGRQGWVDVHGMVANAAWVFALVTAVLAVVSFRTLAPALTGAAVALFVLLIIQTGMGYAIAGGADGLLIVHVPLALLVFGLTVWLSVRAALLGRADQANRAGS